jgi:hypothetical protein
MTFLKIDKFKISGAFMPSGVLDTHSSSDVFRLATQGLLRVKKKRSGSGNRRPRGEYKFLFRPPGCSKVLGFIQELEIRISSDSYGLGLPANIFHGLLSGVQPFYGKGPQPLLRAGRGKIIIGGRLQLKCDGAR